MVEGQSLHYYYNHPLYYHPQSEMDELILPPSPINSAQSDSDNSISSIEIPSSRPEANNKKTGEIRCCWKSCGIQFESLDKLAGHVTRVHATSGAGGLFYCGWDGCTRNSKGFNARYKMLVHVRTHTNEKPHRCVECAKSFSRAENLKIHSRSHSGEKPYVCPVPGCTKAYSNSSDRFKHTRTHQVEKPYQCKVAGCPKRYTDPSSLRKHVKTYRHFVDEHHVVDGEQQKVTVVQHQFRENIIKIGRTTNETLTPNRGCDDECNCMHLCCKMNSNNRIIKGASSSADFMRLSGPFIDFRDEDNKCMSSPSSTTWQNFLNPFLPDQKNVYLSSYDSNDSMLMDVDDLPLDLSVNRKIMFD